ncbi:hypothetical protein CC80DRAFT_459861 [Byssothecium circinans]|uniref:SURF6-domain-containing protein n=1 Tax=Byssothecium circinans TaxID=147558 RepID=A0A6A5UG40_9PLEO|nr:hypothetical protein CC80DRAFT_459861 [Byssothecium circinans]
MTDDLQARLKSHAKAFEGLMSLIPAKDYYGKDESITSTQWMKTKKQSKEERKAAKRAKLDPANHKSAKDVMDENARKRKRELESGHGESSDFEIDGEKEKPREGMKIKKQKTAEESHTDAQKKKRQAQAAADKDAKAKAKADRLKQKREKTGRQQVQKQEKLEAKKAQQEELSKILTGDKEESEEEGSRSGSGSEWEDEQEAPQDRIESLDVSGLVEDGQSTATPSAVDSNTSTASVVSAASSTSSLPPADTAEASKKTNSMHVAPKTHDDFRARLLTKLSTLRAARKAEGPNGQPAKNRAELIEARRKKEAIRKAAKKAQKQLAKEDAERVKAEDQLERIRGGSGSPSVFSHRSTPEQERNFNFGRVAWGDGQQLEGNLTGFLESKKNKGRSDPKTALEAAKNKQARLNGLDEQKRKEIEEKDLWLDAKKRAQGERVHNDTKLLKKSVKRLEKGKLKSEKEWNERKANVDKGREAKQKRREANLRKRREEKGAKGKKKPGKKPSSKAGKGKRAGFEGSLKK